MGSRRLMLRMRAGTPASTVSYARAAVELLDRGVRMRLVAAASLLALLALLDLLAVLLVLFVVRFAADPRTGALPEALAAFAGAWGAGHEVAVLGGAAVLLFALKGVATAILLRAVLRLLAREESRLSAALVQDVMRAPLTFHLRRRHLDLMTDVTVGVEALVLKAVAPLLLVGAELALLAVLVGGLVVAAPMAALVAAGYLGILAALLGRVVGGRMRSAACSDVATTRETMMIVTTMFQGYREIVSRGVEGHFVRRVEALRANGAQTRAELSFLTVLPRYLLETALVVGLALAYAVQVPVVGPVRAAEGLALFAVTGFRLVPSLLRLQGAAGLVSVGQPFGERVLRLREDLSQLGPGAHVTATARAVRLESGIELLDVGFRYSDERAPALDGVTMHLPAKRMTAIVGPSGSGKSTLVDVLLGLLPPSRGRVLVDGDEVVGLRAQWARSVGYVPQVVHVMVGTVRDNVLLGNEASDDQVWAALRRASLDDLVRDLPRQLDTLIGEAEGGLSGGQRQRLGIARALCHQPSVLVLDEATSALDVATEAAISQTLRELDDLTRVVVAHRLSTVRHADHVVFLDAGRVLAAGTFDELARSTPAFAEHVALSDLQAGRRE